MSSMQTPSSEPERVSQEGESVLYYETRWQHWLVFFVLYFLIVAAIVLWQDDGTRLRTLHTLVKLCQNMARVFGQTALALEHEYNEYVQLLH